MENFIYYSPTKVVFGKDSLHHLANEIAQQNATKVLIVYGSNRIESNGLLNDVINQLNSINIEFMIFKGIKANPTLSYAKEGIKISKEFKADFILAIGGGSVIDTAKAIAVGSKSDRDLWDIWCGKETIEDVLPIGCILTIPAAGSELSNSAVLTNEEICQKRGLSSNKYRCKFAIMDPLYAMTLPKKQIACGVTDIMMHTLERFFYAKEKQHNTLTDLIAISLLKTVIKYGKTAYDNPKDYNAMSEIMWASSLSHNDLTGLGGISDFSVHQLGHEISAMFDITHGESLSSLWATWARYVYKQDIDRFVYFANMVWDIEGTGEEVALKGIDALERYLKQLNMPICIPELSCGELDEKTIITLGNNCTRNGSRMIGSFYPIDTNQVIQIYSQANKNAK